MNCSLYIREWILRERDLNHALRRFAFSWNMAIGCSSAPPNVRRTRLGELWCEQGALWDLQVDIVNSGEVSMEPAFKVASYENLLKDLAKMKPSDECSGTVIATPTAFTIS
jgi:hypothetical protein